MSAEQTLSLDNQPLNPGLSDKHAVAVLEFDVGYRLGPGMITNRWQQN